MKAEVNSFSIESESENGIFLFILFTPGHRRVNKFNWVIYLCQPGELTNSNLSFNHVNLSFINFKLGIHLGQPGHSSRSTRSFKKVNLVIY